MYTNINKRELQDKYFSQMCSYHTIYLTLCYMNIHVCNKLMNLNLNWQKKLCHAFVYHKASLHNIKKSQKNIRFSNAKITTGKEIEEKSF